MIKSRLNRMRSNLVSARWGSPSLLGWGAVLAAAAVILTAAGSSAVVEKEREPSGAGSFAAVIVVHATGEGPSRAAIVFSRTVPHNLLKARLERLGKKAGWQISALRLRDEPGQDKEVQTSASFLCNGIVDWQKGTLGVKPLVEEFGSEGRFRVVFLVPGMRNFSGPSGYSDDGVEVKFSPREEAYEYDVVVTKTPPPPPGGAVNSHSGKPKSAKAPAPLLVAIVLFAALGVVIGWLRYGRKKRIP